MSINNTNAMESTFRTGSGYSTFKLGETYVKNKVLVLLGKSRLHRR
jgi:hypothetical protein